MNILNLNKLLKEYGLQEFPLDFEQKLRNNIDKTKIIDLLKQVDNYYIRNPLMFILIYNKTKDLGFKSKDIIDIINLYPEQLNQFDVSGWNPLMFIFNNSKTQELNFNFSDINIIYEKVIDKKYNFIDYKNKKHTILFNEEYILNKLKEFNCDLTFYKEFLDYRKTLLEKQKIIDILEARQKNTITNNVVKI